MEKIAILLMEYGQDYTYDNYASEGEKIDCPILNVTVQTKTLHTGTIEFTHECDTDEYELNDASFSMIHNKLMDIIIEATT